MDTPPPITESAEPAITSYLACLAREGGVEQICFLLAQYVMGCLGHEQFLFSFSFIF